MRHFWGLGLVIGTLSACGPGPVEQIPEGPTSPQYAPDDPCKGVVPQLCAY